MRKAAPFEFVEGVTSDLTFVARGETLEDVFRESAEALLAATVERPGAVRDALTRTLELSDTDLDLLLMRFLNELVFLRDADGLLLRPRRLRLSFDGRTRLEAALVGEALDPERHGLACDVKAATVHGLRVERTPAGWEATVTLDV